MFAIFPRFYAAANNQLSLQGLLLDQRADLRRIERTHPPKNPVALHMLDLHLRQQSLVPDQHHHSSP